MRVMKKAWVYCLICIIAFYLLFLTAKHLGSEIFLILLAYPCFTLIVSVVFGIRNGFDFALPIAIAVAFFPALFYLFSLDYKAWGIYAVVYIVISIIGCGLGRVFHKKKI